MHPVIFTRAARAEMIEAQDWYENEALAWADVSGQRWRLRLGA